MTTATKIWLGASLGIVVIATTVFFIFFYKAQLTVVTTPTNAQVLVNNVIIPANAVTKFSPGTYTVSVRHTDYLSTTQTVKLSIAQKIQLAITLRQIPKTQPLVSSVQFPVLSQDGANLFYLGKDGTQFFQMDTADSGNGKPTIRPISDARFHQPKVVLWSPDRSLAILQTNDGKTTLFDFKRYDFLTQEEVDLGTDLRSITWHPTDPVIMGYQIAPDGVRSLTRKNIRTGVTDVLIDVRPFQLVNPTLEWSPNGREVLVVEGSAYLFDLATRSMKKIPGTDGATAAHFSPTSDHLLVETAKGLSIIDLATANQTPLVDRLTIDKASWSADGQSIVFATPTDQGYDQIKQYVLKTQTTTTFTYLTDQPIHATDFMVGANDHQAWFVSNGTLFHLTFEAGELVR